MAAQTKGIVLRISWGSFLSSLVIVVAIVALVIAGLAPSFVIRLDLENATTTALTVSVVHAGTKESTGCVLMPGEKKQIVLFSGDGYEPDNWIYVAAVMNDNGDIVQTRRMTWRDFRENPWRITATLPAAATVP